MKTKNEIKALFEELLTVYNETEPSEENRTKLASLYAKMQTLVWVMPELEKEWE